MNTFGNNFKVSIFGESHGPVIGVTVDGVFAGIPLSEEDFLEDILRRKAGALGTTPRAEEDVPEIVSGVYDGYTTGAPLTIIFHNNDVHSEDYETFREHPRPGHADFTANIKFGGYNDIRGGGHFSGRLTLGVVAAGVVAKRMLHFATFHSGIRELGGSADRATWQKALEDAKAEGDSLGAVVECVVDRLPIGMGEPFWDSVESRISHAIFSIPGVRGIEFGDGFLAAGMKGSEHNDLFPEHQCCHGEGGHHHEECHCQHDEGEEHHCCGRHKRIQPPVTNHAGGVNGGITNGNPLVFRVAFKPTSSIAKAGIPGRHDVCFALRTPVIVEAMAAIVLADFLR
jgi:chorismate synthase